MDRPSEHPNRGRKRRRDEEEESPGPSAPQLNAGGYPTTGGKCPKMLKKMLKERKQAYKAAKQEAKRIKTSHNNSETEEPDSERSDSSSDEESEESELEEEKSTSGSDDEVDGDTSMRPADTLPSKRTPQSREGIDFHIVDGRPRLGPGPVTTTKADSEPAPSSRPSFVAAEGPVNEEEEDASQADNVIESIESPTLAPRVAKGKGKAKARKDSQDASKPTKALRNIAINAVGARSTLISKRNQQERLNFFRQNGVDTGPLENMKAAELAEMIIGMQEAYVAKHGEKTTVTRKRKRESSSHDEDEDDQRQPEPKRAKSEDEGAMLERNSQGTPEQGTGPVDTPSTPVPSALTFVEDIEQVRKRTKSALTLVKRVAEQELEKVAAGETVEEIEIENEDTGYDNDTITTRSMVLTNRSTPIISFQAQMLIHAIVYNGRVIRENGGFNPTVWRNREAEHHQEYSDFMRAREELVSELVHGMLQTDPDATTTAKELIYEFFKA